jgi:hypothetical protein
MQVEKLGQRRGGRKWAYFLECAANQRKHQSQIYWQLEQLKVFCSAYNINVCWKYQYLSQQAEMQANSILYYTSSLNTSQGSSYQCSFYAVSNRVVFYLSYTTVNPKSSRGILSQIGNTQIQGLYFNRKSGIRGHRLARHRDWKGKLHEPSQKYVGNN